MAKTLLMIPDSYNPARCTLSLLNPSSPGADFPSSQKLLTAGEMLKVLLSLRRGELARTFQAKLFAGEPMQLEISDEEAAHLYHDL